MKSVSLRVRIIKLKPSWGVGGKSRLQCWLKCNYIWVLHNNRSVCRSLPPTLQTRDCKNVFLHGAQGWENFDSYAFVNTDTCFSPCTLAVSVLIYGVATCFLWVFLRELHMWCFSYNLQLVLYVNSYLSFPLYLIVPAIAQQPDFGWLQCL